MTTLGARIAHYRSRFGWSQEKLAREADLPVGCINRYERNVRKPSLDSLQSLAKALQVSLDELVSTETELAPA